MNCQWVQQHVHSILDGELPPEERVACEAHMASCAACTQLLRRAEEEEKGLRSVFVQPTAPNGFAEGVVARLRMRQAPLQSPPSVRGNWRLWWPLMASVAAVLAVCVGLWALSGPRVQPGKRPAAPTASVETPAPVVAETAPVVAAPAPVVATAVSVRGAVFFLPSEGEGWQELSEGQQLRLDARLKTEAGALLNVRIGEAVTSQIDENGLARLTEEGLFLETGRVFCDVKPGYQGFVVETADAAATVKGTRFEVDRRSGDVTQLRVVEGTVEFRNPKGAVYVGANMQARARTGGAPGALLHADHFPAVSWASIDEGSFDFPVDVKLAVREIEGDGRASSRIAAVQTNLDYGETRYGDLWLYCQVMDTSGTIVLRQRERVSSPEHRYRVKKVAFGDVRAGSYRAQFRIGHGEHAAVAEVAFSAR